MPRTAWTSGSRSGGTAGADPGGPEDAVVHRVAGLHDERDRGGLHVLGVLVHERLVQVRSELLPHGAEALHPVRAEHLLVLLGDRVERGALVYVAVLAAQLHVAQNAALRGP